MNIFDNQRPQTVQTRLGLIEYVEFGQGPAVVAIHGAMGGYDQSAILARTVLRESFRVLAISRPGYLGTPGGKDMTPARQAALVAALLDTLTVRNASIIAISGGGPCAISFALEYPERCNALVLISTVSGRNHVDIPLRYHLMKLLAYLPFVTSAMRKKTLENLEQAAARSITDRPLRQRALADSETRSLFAALTASTLDRMAARLPGTENDIRITQSTDYPLESIRVPTLIIHGDRDPLIAFDQHPVAAKNRIPQAELLTLKNGEHAAIFTHRALVRETIDRFLAGKDKSRAPDAR